MAHKDEMVFTRNAGDRSIVVFGESESIMANDRYETPLTPPTTPPVIDPGVDPQAAAKSKEDPEEEGTTEGRRSKRPDDNTDSEVIARGRALEGAGEEELDRAGSPDTERTD